ncbi:MAG: diadenylate cyclase CdaA [Clostridia bacterium]|nr:diadenylate cyclase CdaA [Clostridia bacterium]
MAEIGQWFKDIIPQVTILDAIDVLVVTFLIYQLIKFTMQTRAAQVLKAFGLILVLAQISEWLQLSTLAWISNYVIDAGAIVLVLLFQPEIRRALEKLGRRKFFNQNTDEEDENERTVIGEIVRAVQRMSGSRTGALIVVQNREPLGDIIESGTTLYANVSSELLENIFTPNTPLHDGAVIIKEDTIIAAGCFLPLAVDPYLAQEVGTRHRAAIGMSERTDALVIVVSEETGILSCAKGGKLIRYLDGNSLREMLEEIIKEGKDEFPNLLVKWLRGANNGKS